MIDEIEAVLDYYPDAVRSYETPSKDIPVCSLIKDIGDQVNEMVRSLNTNPLLIRWSYGKGNWTPTPWIAVLDSTFTKTTQSWFYPCLLFRADGSGFYLSLSVATGRPFGTPNKAELEKIASRAQRFRPWFSSLGAFGLTADPYLDLRIDRGVGVGYRYGSVMHKFYDRALLPIESDLEQDIVRLTRAYSDFCSRGDAWDLYNELSITEEELTENINKRSPRSRGTGQGFAVDSKIRRAVEQYAVDQAIINFKNNGWSVDPSPQKNKPYDLLCERAGSVLHVEVKGTVGTGEKVIITRGEAIHALENPDKAVLFVVSNIHIQAGTSTEPVLSGGSVRKLQPWNLVDSELNPISYEYPVISSAN